MTRVVQAIVVTLFGLFGLYLIWFWATHDHAEMIDFRAYRSGAQALVDGLPLYASAGPDTGLPPFIYPPFAAMLFLPFLAISVSAGEVVFVLILVATIAVISYICATQWSTLSGTLKEWPAAFLAAPIFAIALFSEIMNENLNLGQINTIVAAMVIVDSVHRSRYSGFLVGVAAGIKVTPALFIVFMLVTRRWAEAFRAIIGFVVTVLIGLFAGVGQLWEFWTQEIFMSSDRVDWQRLSNASLRGAFARTFPPETSNLLWLLACVALVAGGLYFAAKWWSVNRLVAVAVVGTVSTLVSPIAWIHHWVYLLPTAVILLALTVRTIRSRSLGYAAVLWISTVIVLLPPLTHLRSAWQVYADLMPLDIIRDIQSWGYAAVSLLSVVALAICVPLRHELASEPAEPASDDSGGSPPATAQSPAAT